LEIQDKIWRPKLEEKLPFLVPILVEAVVGLYWLELEVKLGYYLIWPRPL
jgi:hypothetical protein